MNDQEKAGEQLIEELAQVQATVAELRQENARYRAECQRWESARQETERQYKALLYSLPEKVFHKDRQSTYVSCNRNYAADFGLQPEQLIGRTDYDLFPPEIAAKYRADDSRIMASGATEEIEESYCAPLGPQRLIRTVKACLRDEQGQVTGILGIFSDITARKQAEEALRQSEARYRALAEATRDIIYILDRHGTLLYANRAAQRCIGLAVDELLGKRQADLFPAGTAQAHLDSLQRVFATGDALAEDEVFVFGADPVWLRVHLLPLRDEAGEVTAVMGVCHDITERKRAEEALRQAHDSLERRVEERTAELRHANERLQAEVEHRRQAEQALRESEQRMQMALEVSRSFAFEWEPATDRVVRSDSCARVLGLCGAEALYDTGQNFVRRIHPGERDRFVRMLGELKPSQETYLTEYRVTRGDGTTAVLQESACGFFDSQGLLRRLVGVTTDITERKRAEAELRASNERFELVVRGSGVGIWDWDLRTGKVYFSPRWKMLFGYAEHEIGERFEDWVRLLHPDERDQILQLQDDFLAGTGSTVMAEYRLRHKDGTYRWIIAHGLVVRDEHGQACRIVGSHGDITDRRRAEDALRESEAKYRALVESCPDAVAMCDLQGRIVFASERAVQQHGARHPDELLGRQAAELVVAGDRERFRANTRRLIDEGLRRDDEYTAIRKDGTTFDAEISAAVMRDAAGNPEALMGIYRDITQRKRAEERLHTTDLELLAAAKIQAHLLPQEFPRVRGFDIAGRCYPAEAAAGDHFDFLWRPDGSLLVVMGDVSGHGIGPAIVAADFSARLRTLSETACELPEMAVKVNAGLYRETVGEIFVTAILGRLDLQTRRLTCLNAGHPEALVLNAAGQIKARLASGGPPFAIVPYAAVQTSDAVALDDGDLLFFYTDGIPDAHPPGGPFFGIDRAIQIVQTHQDRTAGEIIEALYHAACRHAGAGKPHDDITVVIVKVLAGSAAAPPAPRPGDRAAASPPAPDDSACRAACSPLRDDGRSGPSSSAPS